MTFQVSISGLAANGNELPLEQELQFVQQEVANLRARLEKQGCAITICVVNGVPISNPTPTDVPAGKLSAARPEPAPVEPAPPAPAKHPLKK